MINLSAYQACQFRVTVELWRDAEKFGSVNYDGGNLQFTTAAGGTTGWAVLDGSGMGYDGSLIQCTGTCVVAGEKVWTTSNSPKWKTAVYEAASPPGSTLWLRFTFASDSENTNGPLPGVFVRRVRVEAY